MSQGSAADPSVTCPRQVCGSVRQGQKGGRTCDSFVSQVIVKPLGVAHTGLQTTLWLTSRSADTESSEYEIRAPDRHWLA